MRVRACAYIKLHIITAQYGLVIILVILFSIDATVSKTRIDLCVCVGCGCVVVAVVVVDSHTIQRNVLATEETTV